VQLAKDAVAPLPSGANAAPRTPYVADTGELTFNRDAKVLIVSASQAAGVFGAVGNATVNAGAIDVQLGPTARAFAAILLTALDGLPLASSTRMLLTNPGYSLRATPGTEQPQPLKLYPGTTDWWTVESTNTRPSGV
jgi:hypothetical protein